jgi:uncharacterized protein (TIGR04255 family)
MADPGTADQFPDYIDPPVVETVLGVQFAPLQGLTNAHLGAFWQSLQTDQWPSVSDAELLPPAFEQFDDKARWASGRLRFEITNKCRLQIKNADADRMIQVQNSRLHFNWLKRPGISYPRYETVRREFESTLQDFLQFVNRAKLGELRPDQWEVTYVNQMPKGTVWNDSCDWGFFRLLHGVGGA